MSPDYRYIGAPRGPQVSLVRAHSRQAPVWLLALILAAGGMVAVAPPTHAGSAAAQRACGWRSEWRPPSHIRVLMPSGRVARVPFRTYVARVASSEWGSVPHELRRAGVIAVKQYAWNKALHPRFYRGRCFHVWSSTRDQIYRVKTPRPEVVAAVRSTWGTTLRRHDGSLVFTGYRSGRAGVACARDGGGRLYARSAARCARQGWSAERILLTYYRQRGVRIHR